MKLRKYVCESVTHPPSHILCDEYKHINAHACIIYSFIPLKLEYFNSRFDNDDEIKNI